MHNRTGAPRSREGKHPDLRLDVLERLHPKIDERGWKLPNYVIPDRRGHDNPARLSDGFEAGSDVHRHSEQVTVLGDHIAHMDADTDLNVAFSFAALH